MATFKIDLADYPADYFPPERDKVLGGSELRKAAGLDEFESATRLYYEKLGAPGLELRRRNNTRLATGHRYEGAAIEAANARLPALKIKRVRWFLYDLELRIGCTLDAIGIDPVTGKEIPVEAKTMTVPRYEFGWDDGEGEPDKGRAPIGATLQCLQQAMLLDAPYGLLIGIPLSPFDMRSALVRVARHGASEARIIGIARQFWDDVENHRPPPPNYALDRDLIAALTPQEVADKTVDLTGDNEVISALVERADLKNRIGCDEARVDALDALLMSRMQDAERVVGIPDFRITWKTENRKAYSVPAKSRRVLRVIDKRSA